ncbi:hypothetical protein ACH42_01685 [Endozoicomonas sp. (ex Bugula neritina AB1)]|nr:hypothetical protein ACH42_01685 [Endozoicomonas sp. (ex Bugula neritina AB1)]
MNIKGTLPPYQPLRFIHKVATILALLCLVGCESKAPREAKILSLEDIEINELKMAMLADVASIILRDKELDDTVRNEISTFTITPLRKKPSIQLDGSDSTARPIAVNLQNAFEQSILNMVNENMVSEATVIIHTRKPATPLCNPPGKALPEAMMQHSTKQRKTIQNRTITLRQMASYGPPINLYIAYFKEGLEQRSPKEQAIYQTEVINRENKSLHDTPLTCSTMPDELVGASYILKTRHGHTLFFGNSGTQAIDGKGETAWNYWFGSLKEASVENRYNSVLRYLSQCGITLKQ